MHDAPLQQDATRPLRVAILSWNTPPVPTGLGRAAFEIAGALAQAGSDVTLFDASRPSGEVATLDGIAVRGAAAPEGGRWARVRRLGGVGHLVAPLFFARALAAEHGRKPFDVVEATNWYAPAALLRRRGPRGRGLRDLPLLVRNSTPAIDARTGREGWRDRLDLRFAHRLEARTARRADALISNTCSHAALIEDLYALPPHWRDTGRHRVVPLALDPLTVRAGREASAPKDLRLLFVGRAERRKGFAEALAAHLAVARERQAAGRPVPVLDIVGVGRAEVAAHMGDVDASLAATVATHERVEDAQLHALYAAATLVLAPSRYESFGLVYREAAAFGRPLLACREDPAAVEFVGETGCGLLAERCETGAVAATLRTLLDDAPLRERCRTAGLAAAAELSRERLARDTLAAYRHACAQPASGRRSAATSSRRSLFWPSRS